jgi:hypothetical protein
MFLIFYVLVSISISFYGERESGLDYSAKLWKGQVVFYIASILGS